MSLRHAILALLTIEKGSGYDLVKRFNKGIRYFWASSFQQIYRELQTLEEANSVRYEDVLQEGKPDKKVYEINPAGIEELREWLKKPAKYTTLKEPLLIKIFAGSLADPEALLAELKEHEARHRETLAEYLETERRLLEPGAIDYAFPHQTLKLGITLERAWLEWCEETLKTLPTLYAKRSEANKGASNDAINKSTQITKTKKPE